MTAYELRISDWSSDVGSSDLQGRGSILGEVTAVSKIMGNLNLVLGLGAILLLAIIFGFHGDAFDGSYANWILRYLHVLFGIMWIGLLYYFNFVQIPTMPKVPD